MALAPQTCGVEDDDLGRLGRSSFDRPTVTRDQPCPTDRVAGTELDTVGLLVAIASRFEHELSPPDENDLVCGFALTKDPVAGGELAIDRAASEESEMAGREIAEDRVLEEPVE